MVKFPELVVKVTCSNGEVWYRRIVAADDEETTLRKMFDMFSVAELRSIANVTLLVEPSHQGAPPWFWRGALAKSYDLSE